MGADGGVGVTDSPRGAVQPAARCVHVARVSVHLGECVWGARPAAASDIPGIPPWKWVWPGGPRDKLSATLHPSHVPQDRPGRLRVQRRLRLKRGLPSSDAGLWLPACLDLDFDLDLKVWESSEA